LKQEKDRNYLYLNVSFQPLNAQKNVKRAKTAKKAKVFSLLALRSLLFRWGLPGSFRARYSQELAEWSSIQISQHLTGAFALRQATIASTTASERIASGLRINSAKDDPAGIGQANRLKAQIASYARAADNINSGIAIVQKIDSSLSQISDILISMRDLASSSSSGASAWFKRDCCGIRRSLFQHRFTGIRKGLGPKVGGDGPVGSWLPHAVNLCKNCKNCKNRKKASSFSWSSQTRLMMTHTQNAESSQWSSIPMSRQLQRVTP
jgi:hypothetical protein